MRAIDAIGLKQALSISAILRDKKTIEQIIDEQPTIEPEPKWIPVTEKLPENKTAYYLATIANHGKFFSSTLPDDVDTVRWDYDRRKGNDSWHWCTNRTVLAWMPLPEPWKEGEK